MAVLGLRFCMHWLLKLLPRGTMSLHSHFIGQKRHISKTASMEQASITFPREKRATQFTTVPHISPLQSSYSVLRAHLYSSTCPPPVIAPSARSWAESFPSLSFNPQSDFMESVWLLIPFYRERHWGRETISELFGSSLCPLLLALLWPILISTSTGFPGMFPLQLLVRDETVTALGTCSLQPGSVNCRQR